MTRPIDDLMRRLEARTAVAAVIGLGYVGLPLVRAILSAGLQAIGIDTDPAKIVALNEGRGYLKHLGDDWIKGAVAEGKFRPSGDFAALAEADVIVICVPTPLTRHMQPDLSYVEATGRAIAAHLSPGQLVVLESTTWPGTTREVLKPILEAGGLKAGADFLIAFSPERADPGNTAFDTDTIPKVVGGDGPEALAAAERFYGLFVGRTVPVTSPETAEAVKLFENIFRAVNIALVNELKVVYREMGIDVWEVIEAAKTKPFGFMPFYPGPGLGGHCIPIDPYYLSWKAKEFDVRSQFVELAGEINGAMPRWVVDRLAEALDRETGKGLSRARILVLGLAYKRNVDDIRESPALKLIELIEARGAATSFHDPWVPEIPPTREHGALTGRRSVPLDAATLAAHDAVLLVTDHDNIDYAALKDARLVFDTRNRLARAPIPGATVIKL
jgi:UDP-N-acetyl-D-glucosamine dehydrogenase